MNPNRKVGLDITWRCNWHCRHCFYRHNAKLHTEWDAPMSEICARLDKAKAGGLNHAVMVGFGEPTECRNLVEIMLAIRERGMAASMITNGTAPIRVYENLFELGLDHLHISSHGTAKTLVKVTGDPEGRKRQTELKRWLKDNGLPYRANFSMQQINYQDMLDTVQEEIELGVWHMVLLGFLPHYEWSATGNTQKVLVHPSDLQPHIEASLDALLAAGRHATVRYHPMCRLDPRYWPYVTNARFVYFDPFEWNYELQANDVESLWRESRRIGDGVAAAPCRTCATFPHCGGYNTRCLNAIDGEAISPHGLDDVPEMYMGDLDVDGGIFDRNPLNGHSGTLRENT